MDVRIVAATNRDLKKAVAAGEFREDLYFRLSVFPILIPALRERRRDIPLLARHYIEKFCRDVNKTTIAIPDDCMQALMDYDWPGNVRELANCLERAVILCDADKLDTSHLGLGPGGDAGVPKGFELSGTLAEVGRRAQAAAEKEKIRRVLDEAKGARARAAEILQVSGKTLLHKMREFDLMETRN